MIIGTNLSHAQTWERLISNRSTDAFRSVIETPSEDLVAAGYVADGTSNDTDAFAARFTKQGDTVWTLTLNGPLSRKDLFYKVASAPQGFIFCGYSNSYDASVSERAFMVRTDEQGNTAWTYSWDNPGRSRAQDVVTTQDSGFAAAGYVVSGNQFSGFILRLSANGDTVWSRQYVHPGSNYSDLNSIRLLEDGGFIACGQCRMGNDYDIFLLRTDSIGNVVWSRNLGTVNGAAENGECVYKTNYGFIVCGSTDSTSSNGTTDGFVVATDTSGSYLWSTAFGDPTVNDDFHQITPTSDTGWALCGTTRSYGPQLPNIWLVKTDSIGGLIWNRTFGGNNHDHGYSTVQTQDGGFLCAGYASSFNFNYEDAYLIRCDSRGELEDYLRYGTVSSIVSPAPGSCSSDSVLLIVAITNMGRDTLSNFLVTANITGGGINLSQSWTYPGSIFPGDVVYDSLPASISLIGTSCSLAFDISLDTQNDVIPPRNTLLETRNIIQPPSVTGDERCGAGSVTLTAQAPCENLLWFRQQQGGNIINAGSTFTFQAAGDTTLYVQAGSFCPRIAVQADILPLPVVELEQGVDTAFHALPYNLQAPSGFVSYVWSTFQNTPSIQVNTTGFYCVTVIDMNGCAGNDCVFVLDSVISGQSELTDYDLRTFPNPAADRLVVEWLNSTTEFEAEILDLFGKRLMKERSENGRCVFDIGRLPVGNYLLRSADDTRVFTRRFIKS
ncbi:MAG: T9SS type A sorting domain-containing protein [Bacteroidota bacterium]